MSYNEILANQFNVLFDLGIQIISFLAVSAIIACLLIFPMAYALRWDGPIKPKHQNLFIISVYFLYALITFFIIIPIVTIYQIPISNFFLGEMING